MGAGGSAPVGGGGVMADTFSFKATVELTEDGHALILIPERRVMISNSAGFWDACVTDDDGEPIAHPEPPIVGIEDALVWASEQPEVTP